MKYLYADHLKMQEIINYYESKIKNYFSQEEQLNAVY
jgi:hypothetical protein